jgi:hypothetical protein
MTASAELIEKSTRRMHAGMAAMAASDWRRALVDFENAVRLRHQLPWKTDGHAAWLLAAAWLNHGEAMWQGKSPECLAAAVRSMDGCISAMAHVPLADEPRFADRLILAWINRGTLHGELTKTPQALADLDEAAALLETWGRDASPTRRVLVSMCATHRARILLQSGHAIEAWHASSEALEGLATVDAPSARIKVCSLRCQILATLLEEKHDLTFLGDWIAVASDSAAQALAVARATGRIDDWLPDLVRYAARIHRCCQPELLVGFLREWLVNGPLAADAALREQVQVELLLAQEDLQQRVLDHSGDSAYVNSQIALLQDFQHLQRDLAECPNR